jgi:hypothetical protein
MKSDYDKALRLQELFDQRVDLIWEFHMGYIFFGNRSHQEIFREMARVNLEIKELQNG